MEFQFKRDILGQFNLHYLNATLDHLNGLWSYATTEWLKLTMPTPEDSNRSRWPVHPLWGCIAVVDFEASGGPLTRKFSPERVPSDEFLFRHGLSVLTSFMAKHKIENFEQGAKAFTQALLAYFMVERRFMSQTDFELFLLDRVGAKGRKFNTILNNQDAAYAKAKAEYEAAEEYRKQSDGE